MFRVEDKVIRVRTSAETPPSYFRFFISIFPLVGQSCIFEPLLTGPEVWVAITCCRKVV